jgi:hypothetical protein
LAFGECAVKDEIFLKLMLVTSIYFSYVSVTEIISTVKQSLFTNHSYSGIEWDFFILKEIYIEIGCFFDNMIRWFHCLTKLVDVKLLVGVVFQIKFSIDQIYSNVIQKMIVLREYKERCV